MCRTVGAFFFLGLGAVLCVPLKDGLMVVQGGDTAVVESTVREARQAPEQIEDLLQPDKKDGQESKTLYRISGESKDDKKNKNFLDDFDFVYFGDNSGISKFVSGGDENESGGGNAESYETNESYESGGSGSYDSGDKNEGHASSKSQSYKSDDGDGESGGSYTEEGEEEEDEH